MLAIKLQKRADGMPDQNVACERVVIDFEDPVDGLVETVTAEFDPSSGDNGEFRIIVGDECVYSYLFADID